MKINTPLLGASLLVISLSFNVATAANSSAKLTAKEKALWKKAFGEEIKQSPPQKVKQQTESYTSISGNWVGYYEYDQPQGQPKGMFNVIIKEQGDKFYMTFLEPRNHPKEYRQWGVNNTAKRQGKYIEFAKVYGHNDTEIQYNLTISHDGTIMDGTWKIDGNTYGRAFFYKIRLEELQSIRQNATK